MTCYRVFYNILFISSFMYIMMCPVIHEISEWPTDHNVINKVHHKIKNIKFKIGFRFIPFCLANSFQNNIVQSEAAEKLPTTLSLNPAINHSIFFTLRLILWSSSPSSSTFSQFRGNNSFLAISLNILARWFYYVVKRAFLRELKCKIKMAIDSRTQLELVKKHQELWTP